MRSGSGGKTEGLVQQNYFSIFASVCLFLH